MPSEPEFASMPGARTFGWPSSPPGSPQPQQLLRRHDPERVEHRVQPRHVVALRREVHVAVGVVEAELRGVQLLVEQEDDDVHRAEARAEMARARPLDRGQRVEPAHVGDHVEPRLARVARTPTAG